MSGATENRWRRGAPNSQSSSSSNQSGQQQRQQLGTQRSGSKGATTSAWGQNKAGTNAGSGQQNLRTGPSPSSGTTTQATPEARVHVPINGYNAEEVKEYMRKAYRDTIASVDGDEKAILYKPPTEARPSKPAWGIRPNFMSNGRDFWVELSKQVKALEEEQKKSK